MLLRDTPTSKDLTLQYYYGGLEDFYKQNFLGLKYDLPVGPGTLRTAHPRWLQKSLKAFWPEQWEAICAANNAHPPMILRVNRRHHRRDDYLQLLATAGINATACVYSVDGIVLEAATDVRSLPGFAEGWISVQDEAAQLAADLLDLAPGQRVLDAPCYFNFHANLALHGVKVLTIERRPDGFDFVALEQLLAEHRPSLYLTTSVLHNPTGHSFSPGQAFRLLQLTRQYQCHIIEDDLYGDLHPNPPPRLAALAGLDQVTYLSGFSKILSANTRVSYVVAAPQLAANLTNMKLMSGGITSI